MGMHPDLHTHTGMHPDLCTHKLRVAARLPGSILPPTTTAVELTSLKLHNHFLLLHKAGMCYIIAAETLRRSVRISIHDGSPHPTQYTVCTLAALNKEIL